jgi:hypothetical protein
MQHLRDEYLPAMGLLLEQACSMKRRQFPPFA